jgi:hypothetical protein
MATNSVNMTMWAKLSKKKKFSDITKMIEPKLYSTVKVFMLKITLAGDFSQCNTLNVCKTSVNYFLYIVEKYTYRVDN